MLNDKRILFFVPEGDFAANGVYASQVGGLAKYVESLGAEVLVWQKANVGKMKFFQCIGRYRKAAREESSLKAFRPTHIYCRTFQTCLAARELARETGAKIVYSMRGADAAEAMLGKNLRGWILAAYAAWCVRRAVKVASHVNAVSKTMAEWIKRKWGREASVLPCCVSEVHAESSSPCRNGECAEGNGKTVVYCGGLSAWQKIDEIIALMKKMGDVDQALRFRFLAKDGATLARKCAAAGLAQDRWTAKACAPNEVPNELAKADCGIIIRDDTLVNQVASPIKVGEYLAAGLGVITSPYIGDVARDLNGKSFAKMVTCETKTEELVAFVNGLGAKTREEAQQWVREHLMYEGNKAVVMEMFS